MPVRMPPPAPPSIAATGCDPVVGVPARCKRDTAAAGAWYTSIASADPIERTAASTSGGPWAAAQHCTKRAGAQRERGSLIDTVDAG